MEGTGGNCVEGHYIKRELQESALDLIRMTAERCDSLQGFFFVNSLNSGTGAGLNEGLASRIGIDYSKKNKIMSGIFPSNEMQTSIVENYNFTLAYMGIHEHLDMTIAIQNQQLYRICSNFLKIDSPNYSNIN
jgi:hypothetical protein